MQPDFDTFVGLTLVSYCSKQLSNCLVFINNG